MKFHIVGNGENVDDILKGYDLSLDELKNENKHIRLWDKLIPGTKLKIPVLSENLVVDINEIEPFIEDYYPKIKIEEEVKVINDFEFENQSINEVQNINDFIDIPIESKQEIKIPENNNNINHDNINKEERKNSVPEQKRYYRNNAYYLYQYPYYRPIIYVVPRH